MDDTKLEKNKGENKDRRPKGMGRGRPRREREPSEFDQRNIEIARVTRVMAGGKRMRFRALVVIGDHKGRIGYALAKGADVTLAVNKAVATAKKNVFTLKLAGTTIPHAVHAKYKAAKVLLKPAPEGTGVIAGGAVRPVLELAGIQNIVSKSLGSSNKTNNVKVTFKALRALKLNK